MQQSDEIDYDFSEDLEAGAKIKALLSSVISETPVTFGEPDKVSQSIQFQSKNVDLMMTKLSSDEVSEIDQALTESAKEFECGEVASSENVRESIGLS